MGEGLVPQLLGFRDHPGVDAQLMQLTEVSC